MSRGDESGAPWALATQSALLRFHGDGGEDHQQYHPQEKGSEARAARSCLESAFKGGTALASGLLLSCGRGRGE